jgi:hypothetical protein
LTTKFLSLLPDPYEISGMSPEEKFRTRGLIWYITIIITAFLKIFERVKQSHILPSSEELRRFLNQLETKGVLPNKSLTGQSFDTIPVPQQKIENIVSVLKGN